MCVTQGPYLGWLGGGGPFKGQIIQVEVLRSLSKNGLMSQNFDC